MTKDLKTTQDLHCYDNGGKTCDRYTVVYPWDRNSGNGLVSMLGMSERPFHPQGFGQHCEGMDGIHLGASIPFTQLPEDCQKAALQDLEAYNA